MRNSVIKWKIVENDVCNRFNPGSKSPCERISLRGKIFSLKYKMLKQSLWWK